MFSRDDEKIIWTNLKLHPYYIKTKNKEAFEKLPVSIFPFFHPTKPTKVIIFWKRFNISTKSYYFLFDSSLIIVHSL